MTLDNLKEIKEELKLYKRDKSTLLVSYINDRLNKSLKTYYDKMNESFNYIAQQNELKVLKNLKNGK